MNRWMCGLDNKKVNQGPMRTGTTQDKTSEQEGWKDKGNAESDSMGLTELARDIWMKDEVQRREELSGSQIPRRKEMSISILERKLEWEGEARKMNSG